MKTKIYFSLLVVAFMSVSPLPSEAQLLKKIGDFLEKVAKGSSNSQQASATNAQNGNKARYQIHETANTKKMIIREGASQLCPFSCGVALVNPRHGEWFVIDKQGNKLFELPKGYSPRGEEYDNDRLMITSSTDLMSDWYVRIIDTKGQTIKDLGKVKSATAIIDGVARITAYEKREKKTYYVNQNGEVLSRTLPASKLFHLSDGLRVFGHDTGLSTQGPWGFCDAKCNIVIPAKFEDVGAFHNGLAQAQNDDGLWGFIDKTGAWAIQPQFSKGAGAFKGPYSLVYDKSGCAYFMNQQGEFVWKDTNPNEGKEIREFMSTGYAIWSLEGWNKSYLIDSSFKKHALISTEMAFSNGEVVNYNNQYFQWKWNNLGHINRIIDWNGNVLLEFEGDTIMEEGICSYKDEYYFNDKGEIIIKFEDTQF